MKRPLKLLPFLLPVIVPTGATLATEIPAGPAAGDGPGAAAELEPVRPQDSLWLVSTRHLACPGPNETALPALAVGRYDPVQGWQESDVDQLLRQQVPSPLTVLYVHGNREDRVRAEATGRLAYQSLLPATGVPEPLRFIIWSWPADRIRGPVRDVRVKAERSDYDSYYLAQFLAALDPPAGDESPRRFSLFGFSYGARMIPGTLHLLGGGDLVGLQLPATPPERRNVRAVLMAAAAHDYWLLPERERGRGWTRLDQLLVQYNPCDPALRLYPRLDRCASADALGFSGFPWAGSLGADEPRLHQQNVSGEIGRQHRGELYLQSAAVMEAAQRYLLWADPK